MGYSLHHFKAFNSFDEDLHTKKALLNFELIQKIHFGIYNSSHGLQARASDMQRLDRQYLHELMDEPIINHKFKLIFINLNKVGCSF